MGQKLSMFIDSQLARANVSEEQAKIERGILEALEDWYDEMKDRSCGHGVERDEKKAIRARKHPPPFLNPQRIVSDETIQHWRTIARQDDPIIKEYIHQALKVPLTIGEIDVVLAHPSRSYKMPIVRAEMLLRPEEEEAFNKAPVLRHYYPGKNRGVRRRTEEIPAAVRESVHAVADADLFLCGIVVPKVMQLVEIFYCLAATARKQECYVICRGCPQHLAGVCCCTWCCFATRA